MSAPTYRCDAVIPRRGAAVGQCKRPAAWSNLLYGGHTVRECEQHHKRNAGLWRLLAPFPFEIISTVRTRDEV